MFSLAPSFWLSCFDPPTRSSHPEELVWGIVYFPFYPVVLPPESFGTELLPPLSYSPSPGCSGDKTKGGGGTNYGSGYGENP